MKNLFIGILLLGNSFNLAQAQELKAQDLATGESIRLQTSSVGNSTLIITNKSTENVVTFVIQGAPKTGIKIELNGSWVSSLDGTFFIPPNFPAFKLHATGDFSGATLHISNVTQSKYPATAEVQLIQ